MYILDHSIVKIYHGIQPNFTSKDLSLMIYTDSGNKKESEVKCIISDKIEKIIN